VASPQPPYRLSWMCLAELRRLRDRALQLGVGPQLRQALQTITARLADDPLDWGDPLFRLRGLSLLVHLRIHAKLRVVYGVHDTQRVVFVRGIQPVFDHPLAG